MTNRQKAFSKAEDKERNVLTQLFAKNNITEYDFTENGSFDRHDVVFTQSDKTYIGEIKCRNISSTAYNDSLIDFSKINYLLEQGVEQGMIPLIIVHYSDNVVCVWNLFKEVNNNSIKIESRYCNRTSVVNNGRTEKKIVLLNLKTAKKVQL
jgi:hypothetical protein